MYFKSLFFLLSVLFFYNIAASQNIFTDKTNQKIWEAKDRNDVVYTKYLLDKGKTDQKILVLKGLQSWHDVSFRKPLVKLARRGNVNVKIAALEAIGQSRDSFYIPYLLKIINGRRNKKTKPAALVALGKCITKSKVGELLEIKNKLQPGYAECIYRAMLKGVGNKELTRTILKNLFDDSKDFEASVFYSACYLARTPNFIDSEDSIGLFTISYLLLSSINYREKFTEVSIPLIAALGKAKVSKNDSIVKGVLDVYLELGVVNESISDALNLIATFRAISLGKFEYDSVLIKVSEAFDYPAVQLAYSELASKNCKAFEKYPDLTYGPAIVNLNKTIECNNGKLKLPVTNTIYDKIWNLQLTENYYNFYSVIKNTLIQTPFPAVKSAAMESLIKCRNSNGFPSNLVPDFNETVSVLIDDADEGAVSIIANAILDKVLIPEAVWIEKLKTVQSKLSLPRDMEAFLDIEKVKAMVDKTVYKKPDAEWNNPIDWNHVSKISQNQLVKVTTNKGTFSIRMNVNEAPGSVSSILKLVESGFYNGKYFHRMVPNFVLQGGCPRGDGFGSQDYTLRSEFSSLKYSTGAVGLASAGPDTESCQWFVTHCATPHLDGRYTIIGYVTEGMETIHKLGVGDIMIKVERVW